MLSVDDINKLQQENKRLNDIIDSYQPRIQKYKDVFQEIKAIAERILDKNEFVYMNYRDVRQIIRLITKAEEE